MIVDEVRRGRGRGLSANGELLQRVVGVAIGQRADGRRRQPVAAVILVYCIARTAV